MKYETTVHRWKTKSEYYDIEDGTELRKNNVIKNYDIIRKHKQIKIENNHGTITWINECQRKRQLRIWGN